jgi:flagella basal body P-ring formation protein FlgA
MKRIIALIIAALWTASPAAGATLVPVVTVAAPVVHLGDIFTDAGIHADETAAPSPPAGTRITYGADWLAGVAREHGLDWKPGSSLDQVTIVRSSRVIDGDAIVQQLMAEIAARQPVENAELYLDNPGLTFVVPTEAAQGIAIDGLTIDRHTGRVSAFVSAPPGDPAAKRRQVTAMLIYRVAVPVLAHAMTAGTTILAADVDTVTMRRDGLPPDCATDPSQLIGKASVRGIEQGKPVRLSDLAAPLLVHRGELVTVVLETGNLHLTSQGKALEDGAAGAVVRIQNTKSTRVIDATVLSGGVVGVAALGDALPAPRVAQQ